MKCLVTGGAGFIGSHLVELLIMQGHEVIALDNLTSGRLINLTTVESNPKFVFFDADIRDSQAIAPAFIGVDWVFHLAGLADIVPSIEMPDQYFATNVTGTFNVLECAKVNGIKRVVYAASSSSYGIPGAYPTDESSPIKPQYPYALTKYMGEELTLHWSRVYRLPAVSLRLFNVYGTRSRTTGAYGAVFGVFLAQKFNQRPLTVVGDGFQTRDFTYVTDVARAFYMAAQSNVTGQAMNVGSGNHYSINQLVELLGGAVEYIPKRPGEPDCTFAKVEKIKKLLNWRPEVSFRDGVDMMLADIENWRDAPVWNPSSIQKATQSWFKYLGDN
jgi:UDP-glucose 4-epimerase